MAVFHVIVCIFLILVVLLQQGKGADWAGAFGGGGSQTTFGARGAGTILSRATTAAAIIFMITSLTLAWRSSHSDSVLRSRRNIAAQDAAKKAEGTTKPLLPTGQTAPAPATGGAAVPVEGAPKNDTPATPAPAGTKGPAAPTAPRKK